MSKLNKLDLGIASLTMSVMLDYGIGGMLSSPTLHDYFGIQFSQPVQTIEDVIYAVGITYAIFAPGIKSMIKNKSNTDEFVYEGNGV